MEIKKTGIPWNNYIIITKGIDLFSAWRALNGSNNINMDIAIYCDIMKAKLIDVYGEELEDGRTGL